MMLVHIGQWEIAQRVHNAWLRTLEDGVHTYDIFKEGLSKERLAPANSPGLSAASASCRKAEAADYSAPSPNASNGSRSQPHLPSIDVVGIDLYCGSNNQPAQDSVKPSTRSPHEGLTTHHGRLPRHHRLARWHKETFVVDNYRCRFEAGGKPCRTPRSPDFTRKSRQPATTS